MRFAKRMIAVLTVALLFGVGAASASDLNEVGALLVYPALAAFAPGPAGQIETFVTVTNTGVDGVTAHASFIDGDSCFECNFSFPLTGYDTETLVLTADPITQTTLITSMDGTVNRSCPYEVGMLVISLEDGNANTITDNLLFGEQVLVNYTLGYAFSIPAIPFQGGVGDGNRQFKFDGVEYSGFPRRVAADFLTPNAPGVGPLFVAEMVLFTLNFESQFEPFVDCSVNGFDAHENNFSNSILFGCWEYFDLCQDVDPEFCYPNLGNPGLNEHGWIALDCNSNGADGGVHGAIVQVTSPGTTIRRNAPGPAITGGWTAWGRLLYQSATAGNNTTFIANLAPAGPGGFD